MTDENKLCVNVSEIKKTYLPALNKQINNCEKAINGAFSDAENYGKQWYDDQTSEEFKTTIDNYKKQLSSFISDIRQLSSDISDEMAQYEKIELLGKGWCSK